MLHAKYMLHGGKSCFLDKDYAQLYELILDTTSFYIVCRLTNFPNFHLMFHYWIYLMFMLSDIFLHGLSYSCQYNELI